MMAMTREAPRQRALSHAVAGVLCAGFAACLVALGGAPGARAGEAPVAGIREDASAAEAQRRQRMVSALVVSPDGERAAFVTRGPTDAKGHWQALVGVVRLQEGNQAEWVDTELSALSPAAWSPDASALAFSGWNEEANSMHIVLYDVRTRALRLLTTTEGAVGDMVPEWSPRGDWIASNRSGLGPKSSDWWIVRPDGGEARPVTTSGLAKRNSTARWSLDGRWLYYVRLPSPDSRVGDVYAVDVERPEQPEQRITRTGDVYLMLQLSPDGQYLLCQTRSEPDTGECLAYLVPIADPDGTRVVLRQSGDHNFSPGSDRLVFLDRKASSGANRFDLGIMRLGGELATTRLIGGVSGLAWRNAWTPRGQIVFTRDDSTSIWVVNEDGGNKREIFRLAGPLGP